MTDVPDEVLRLAAEREERRRAKDYQAADALRDRIAELGFRILDSSGGAVLERLASTGPKPLKRMQASEVVSVLHEPATFDASIEWVCEGWPEDISRALAAFRANEGGRSVQYVIADVAGTDPAAFGEGAEVLSLAEGSGWAAARNAGLRRSRGGVVLAVDGSVEPTGDLLGPLEAALADETVGVCGPFGIVTKDLRSFDASDGPEVDAIEGYLMAFRRDLLGTVGLFDERFRWYRTADIEFSFRVKDAGLRAVVVEMPVERHEHRMWFNTPPDEREKWSKRNYYRFLDRFRGRFDLLVSGPEEPA
ncbi:MAG TPA: glycosyltransferase [Actinomycetota bacterium]